LDFSQQHILESSIAPIREEIEEQFKFAQSGVVPEFIGSISSLSDQVTSMAEAPFDVATQVQIGERGESAIAVNNEYSFPFENTLIDGNEIFNKQRHKFYRILVREYRAEFGENDARVSPALNLLAAYLTDIGELNEAESILRESILLADDEHKAVARQLLASVASKQKKQDKVRQP
jgi:hypothetical protein